MKTNSQIKRRYNTLLKRQYKIEDEIKALQTICAHPNVVVKKKSDTGNYDPTTNCITITTHCPDCGHRTFNTTYYQY